jgi:hypothetical protein
MHYWAVVIFRESFEAQRFDTEREAMAYAQVHARMPDAELVAVDACSGWQANDHLGMWPRRRSVATSGPKEFLATEFA